MKEECLHPLGPPFPPFPPARARPYRISGNHVSNFTVYVSGMATAPITRWGLAVLLNTGLKHVRSAKALNVDLSSEMNCIRCDGFGEAEKSQRCTVPRGDANGNGI